jgi:hypothetical protein
MEKGFDKKAGVLAVIDNSVKEYLSLIYPEPIGEKAPKAVICWEEDIVLPETKTVFDENGVESYKIHPGLKYCPAKVFFSEEELDAAGLGKFSGGKENVGVHWVDRLGESSVYALGLKPDKVKQTHDPAIAGAIKEAYSPGKGWGAGHSPE